LVTGCEYAPGGVQIRTERWRHEFYVVMEEFGRLSGSLDQLELAFVEREATPKFLMKLSIHRDQQSSS